MYSLVLADVMERDLVSWGFGIQSLISGSVALVSLPAMGK